MDLHDRDMAYLTPPVDKDLNFISNQIRQLYLVLQDGKRDPNWATGHAFEQDAAVENESRKSAFNHNGEGGESTSR